MGFFSFLHKGPKQMQDEIFGLITFRPYKGVDVDYFVGNVYFAPIGDDVDLFLYADYKGPTQSHTDFFKKLENEYESYVKKAIPLLHATLPSAITQDFEKEFKLVCITFPQPDTGLWKLEYSTEYDTQHTYTIEFTDENATRITKEPNA